MAAVGDIGRNFAPVVDASIEDMNFIAAKVVGCEDLNVAEAVADGVFAETAGHECEVASGEQQAGHSAGNHEQRHHGATAIAKDVAKRKKQELAHGALLQWSCER